MPDLDGISALPLLLRKKRDLVVIMASTLTRRSAEVSLRALALGAADYVPKPEIAPDAATSAAFQPRADREDPPSRPPRPTVRACRPDKRRRQASRPVRNRRRAPRRTPKPTLFRLRPFARAMPRALLIGSSTGGPQALTSWSGQIGATMERAPVLITQHMPPTFTTVLAEHLTRVSGRRVHEAEHGEPVVAGSVYVAPGGRHMRVRAVATARQRSRSATIRRSISASPRSIRCFPSAAEVWGAARSGAGAHRHGQRRHPRRRRYRRRRRQRDRPGRSDERGVGHAALGRASRACARRCFRSVRSPPRSIACSRGIAHDAARLRFSAQMPEGTLRSGAVRRQAISGREPPAAGRAPGRAWRPWRTGDARSSAAMRTALMTTVVEAMTTNETFFFRDKTPFENFRSTILPALMAARRELAVHSHLVRRRLDRAGAIFARHDAQGDGARARRLAHRDPGNRPLNRSAGKGAAGHLQPVRSAARLADSAFDQVFHPGRRDVADRTERPRDGQIPAAQLAGRLHPSRHV